MEMAADILLPPPIPRVTISLTAPSLIEMIFPYYAPLGIKILPGKTPREIDWQKRGRAAGRSQKKRALTQLSWAALIQCGCMLLAQP
jgi:hypothetical protein